MAVHMVLASEDRQYIEALLDYVNCSEFGQKVSITAFSQPEAFIRYMEDGSKRIELIAAEPPFLSLYFSSLQEGNLLQGTDGRDDGDGREDRNVRNGRDGKNSRDGRNVRNGRDERETLPWVCLSESGREESFERAEYKYQPLHELLPALLKAVEGETAQAGGTGGVLPVRVIGFYSAAGGVGKTTTALQTARMLSEAGAKVFFLNLECFQGEGLRRESDRGGDGADRLDRLNSRPVGLDRSNEMEPAGLSELLYELKASAEAGRLPDKGVSYYSVKHPLAGCEAFPEVANVRELLEMSGGDTALLIDYIAGSGQFDFVVVDSEAGAEERTFGLLARCDSIVWLLTDDAGSMAKSAACLRFLETRDAPLFRTWLKKTVFVLNKFYGSQVCVLPRDEMKPAFKLPYLPEWKQRSSLGEFPDSPVFKRDIMKLCRCLESGNLQGGSMQSHEGEAV